MGSKRKPTHTTVNEQWLKGRCRQAEWLAYHSPFRGHDENNEKLREVIRELKSILEGLQGDASPHAEGQRIMVLETLAAVQSGPMQA